MLKLCRLRPQHAEMAAENSIGKFVVHFRSLGGLQPEVGGVDRQGNSFESNMAFTVPFSARPWTKFVFEARPLTFSTIGPNAAARVTRIQL